MAITLKFEIIKAFSDHREGLTAAGVADYIDSDDPRCIAALICRFVQEGFLRADGRSLCKGCGFSHASYRISELDRLWLTEKLEMV